MKQNGFTLLELSIVLVIIGLIVGGITVGADMIRAAELRAVITEHQRYVTAVHTFRDKYFYLPGDMPNAEDFWGGAPSCPDTAGSGSQTCNGDGDSTIVRGANASEYEEYFTFWQHLANAGMIEGQYTGIAGPNDWDQSIIGENSPQSKLGGGATWAALTSSGGGVYQFSWPSSATVLMLGGVTSDWASAPVLTTEEAWSVDKKLDDGHASKGKVWAMRWNECTPATSATDYETYDLTVEGLQCGLVFMNSFR